MTKAEIIIPFPLAESSQKFNRVETFTIGQRQFDIKIPPGISVGQKLRLRGIAHHIHPTLLLVLASSSMIYHVKRDVHLELPLDPRQKERGIIQSVSLEDKKFDIKVPAGIEFGKKIRMGDMARLCNGGYPGDVFLKVVPITRPKKRFLGIFSDFDVLVGRKFVIKVGIPGLFEFGGEWGYARTPAEIKLGTQ